MGYKLRREIRDLLWPGCLTPSERVLLLEIADYCDDEKRTGWPGVETLAAKCDIPSAKRVGEHLASIAAKWHEVRVELGKDRHGKPFYAIPGKKMTYLLPTRDKLVDKHGSDKVPEFQGLYKRQVPENQGAKVPEIQGGNPPKSRDPNPQFESLKENHSSLSPDLGNEAAAPTVPEPRAERESGEASQNLKSKKPANRNSVLIGAGLTQDEAGSFSDWVDTNLPGGPKGDGWYIRLHSNGTLADRIADWRDSGTSIQPACGVCDGTGETGDYLNRRMCPCVWFTDPARARKDWVPQLNALAPCEHGINGGDEKAPNGWQFCSQCRGPGWVDLNDQGRTDNRDPHRKRSTSVLRAEQGLRVADRLDRQFGHGKCAGQPSVGAIVTPGGYVRMVDSHHPDRDYTENL